MLHMQVPSGGTTWLLCLSSIWMRSAAAELFSFARFLRLCFLLPSLFISLHSRFFPKGTLTGGPTPYQL